MIDSEGSRASLIAALQEVRDDGACIPLSFAAREIGSLPVGRIIEQLIAIQTIEVDADALGALPEGLGNATANTQQRLAEIMAGSTHEAAAIAALNAQAMVDRTTAMEAFGTSARLALVAMREAITVAVTKAQEAAGAIDAARVHAENGGAAQTQFVHSMDGYIAAI